MKTQLIGFYTKSQIEKIFSDYGIKQPLPTMKTQVVFCPPYEKVYFSFKKEKQGGKWFFSQYMNTI